MINIAVDAMGGDYAPKEQVEGAMLAIRDFEDVHITLYGDESTLKKYLRDDTRVDIVHTTSTIDMGEKDPIHAIRGNRDSSMARALESVRQEKNDAVVSSGATQALIAGAHILVGRMKKMKRTAIAPVIPTAPGGKMVLLDSGGNLEIKPEYMVQQAYFASIYAEEILGIESPRVGLINIGTEEGKGRDLDNEAYRLFKENDNIRFYGNVEPKDVLNPPADILISDGFTANIVMKTIEGTAKGMGDMLKQEMMRGISGKIVSALALRKLKRFKRRLDPAEIGGAMIYGLRGVVIKAQGSSRRDGFYNAIRQASDIVRQDVIAKVADIIEQEGA